MKVVNVEKKLIEKFVEEFNLHTIIFHCFFNNHEYVFLIITSACFYFHWYLKEERYQYY